MKQVEPVVGIRQPDGTLLSNDIIILDVVTPYDIVQKHIKAV
jgi:hypothetical protein